MKNQLLALAAALSLASMPAVVNAKGCLKGAAAGAVGGHVAGHHAVLGAAAGCAVGHHLANKKPAASNAQPAPPAGAAPTSTSAPSKQ